MQISERDARHATELRTQIGELQKAIEHISRQIDSQSAVADDADQTQLVDDMKDMQVTSMTLKRRATLRLEYISILGENAQPDDSISEVLPTEDVTVMSSLSRTSESSSSVTLPLSIKAQGVRVSEEAEASEVSTPYSPGLSPGLFGSAEVVSISPITNSGSAFQPTSSSAGGTSSPLSAKEFEGKLSMLLATSAAQIFGTSRTFSEDTIIRVAELLFGVGQIKWSERPRTYLVLRLINEVKVIDDLVLHGYKDIDLPYTESTLPDCIKELGVQHEFLQKQQLVLSEKSADLIQGGRHRHLGKYI